MFHHVPTATSTTRWQDCLFLKHAFTHWVSNGARRSSDVSLYRGQRLGGNANFHGGPRVATGRRVAYTCLAASEALRTLWALFITLYSPFPVNTISMGAEVGDTGNNAVLVGKTHLQLVQPVLTLGLLLRPRLTGCFGSRGGGAEAGGSWEFLGGGLTPRASGLMGAMDMLAVLQGRLASWL